MLSIIKNICKKGQGIFDLYYDYDNKALRQLLLFYSCKYGHFEICKKLITLQDICLLDVCESFVSYILPANKFYSYKTYDLIYPCLYYALKKRHKDIVIWLHELGGYLFKKYIQYTYNIILNVDYDIMDYIFSDYDFCYNYMTENIPSNKFISIVSIIDSWWETKKNKRLYYYWNIFETDTRILKMVYDNIQDKIDFDKNLFLNFTISCFMYYKAIDYTNFINTLDWYLKDEILTPNDHKEINFIISKIYKNKKHSKALFYLYEKNLITTTKSTKLYHEYIINRIYNNDITNSELNSLYEKNNTLKEEITNIKAQINKNIYELYNIKEEAVFYSIIFKNLFYMSDDFLIQVLRQQFQIMKEENIKKVIFVLLKLKKFNIINDLFNCFNYNISDDFINQLEGVERFSKNSIGYNDFLNLNNILKDNMKKKKVYKIILNCLNFDEGYEFIIYIFDYYKDIFKKHPNLLYKMFLSNPLELQYAIEKRPFILELYKQITKKISYIPSPSFSWIIRWLYPKVYNKNLLLSLKKHHDEDMPWNIYYQKEVYYNIATYNKIHYFYCNKKKTNINIFAKKYDKYFITRSKAFKRELLIKRLDILWRPNSILYHYHILLCIKNGDERLLPDNIMKREDFIGHYKIEDLVKYHT